MSIRDDLRQRVDATFDTRNTGMQPSKSESCTFQTLGDATCNFSEIRATERATSVQRLPAKPRGIGLSSATGHATPMQQVSCTDPENKTIDATAVASAQWCEFEALLAIVGPAYNTPQNEYPLIRETAARDLNAALVAFREMAHQVLRQSPKPNGDT